MCGARKAETGETVSGRWKWLTALGLVIGVWAAFWPALSGEFVNYDDGDYVANNAMVQRGLTWEGVRWAFTTREASNWHPLTWLSHMADWSVFGEWAAGHHAVNIGLHGLNAALVLAGLGRMTGQWWRSALAAGVFAVHPLRVESVAWIAERKDVLSVCLGLLAIGAYARYARGTRWGWYGVSVGLTACSLMAKPTLVTMPCLLMLIDVWPLRRIGKWEGAVGLGRMVLEKLPYAALAAWSSMMTMWAQGLGGAVVGGEVLTVELRVANAVVSYATYLRQMVWPADLAVLYLHPLRWPVETVAASAAVVAAVSGAVLWSRRAAVVAGWLWYLGALVPVIGLVQVGAQAHADRYTYVAMMGVVVMGAWALPGYVFEKRTVAWRTGAAIAVMVVLGTLTWRQCGHWKSSISLWRQTINATTERNAVAELSLAAGLLKTPMEGEDALGRAHTALELDSYYVSRHNIYAITLIQLGRYEEALRFLEEVAAARPARASELKELGKMYIGKGGVEEQRKNAKNAAAWYLAAVDALTRAVAADGGDAEARMSLGRAYMRARQPAAAVGVLWEAVRLNEQGVEARNELAAALAATGNLQAAAGEFRTVLEQDPGNADALRGLALIERIGQRATGGAGGGR